MARQPGEVRTGRIRSHRLALLVEVETSQFIRRKLLEQLLGSFAGREPLLFQFPEIDRPRRFSLFRSLS